MKGRILLGLVFGMLVGQIAGVKTAGAVSIKLTPTVVGLAADTEFDGNFERIENRLGNDTCIGRVMYPELDYCERRAILEFNISGIPHEVSVGQATLSMNWSSGSNGWPNTNLYGFVGNGTLDANDVTQTTNLIAANLWDLYSVNIANFVQDLVDNSVQYAGILGVETIDGANRNYGSKAISLTIDYTPIPEPSSIFLFSLCIAGFIKTKIRKNKKV